MTTSILVVLGILVVAIVLFVSEKLRPDLVAVMVMLSLALTGVLSPEEAVAGFSNEAVITIAAVLILSGGLMRTGVAHVIGGDDENGEALDSHFTAPVAELLKAPRVVEYSR